MSPEFLLFADYPSGSTRALGRIGVTLEIPQGKGEGFRARCRYRPYPFPAAGPTHA